MNRICLALVAALSLAFANFAAAQETRTLSRIEALQVATQAVDQGNLLFGEQIARALLQKDPKDAPALLILGRVAASVGKTDDAMDLYKRAYRNSSEKTLRYDAAVFVAKTLSATERPERAKLWLRRAVQNATSMERRENALRGFQQMRRQSPWRTNLSFGITPSNNVNNGSGATEICTVFLGCSASVSDTEPVAGAFITGFVGTDYRLYETKTKRLLVGFDLYHRETWIKPGDREKTTSDASDFNYTYLGGRLQWDGVLRAGLTTTEKFSLGKSFYGGSSLNTRVSFSKSFTKALQNNRSIGLTAGIARERNHQVETRSLTQLSFSVPYSFRTANSDFYRITAHVSDTRSDDQQTAHRAGRLSLDYTPAKGVLNIRPSFSFYIGRREDKDQSIFTEIRKDTEYGLSASFAIPQIELYGFRPVAVIEARKTSSTVPLYDTSSISSRIEFRSAF